MLLTDSAADWNVLTAAADHGLAPGLYASGWYQWSPLLAPAFAVVAPMGLLGWRLMHVAAALALPTWQMRMLALVSWPLWLDISVGNVGIFIVVAAAWAIRGSYAGGLIFLTLTLLIPRPLMLPVAAWLLWRCTRLRLPFVVIVGALGSATLASGLAWEWGEALLRLSGGAASWSAGAGGWDFNIGPSRFVGGWWLIIGLPLAAWLTLQGRVGWASLAASPYLLPFYCLFALLEADDSKDSEAVRAASRSTS